VWEAPRCADSGRPFIERPLQNLVPTWSQKITLRAPFLASRSLLWAHSVRPYDRLQDRANLERGTRWSKSSG